MKTLINFLFGENVIGTGLAIWSAYVFGHYLYKFFQLQQHLDEFEMPVMYKSIENEVYRYKMEKLQKYRKVVGENEENEVFAEAVRNLIPPKNFSESPSHQAKIININDYR